jgi:RNA polymerase sigma-70 factor (ECF subfamily)
VLQSSQRIQSCEELAEHCQDGDQQAYAELLERYGPRIHGFLLKLVGNTHDAQDLTQDVFVKAYRNIHNFDTQRPFAPWLFTIARRTAATFHRKIRPTVEFEREPPSDEADPHKQAESRDDCERIWNYARMLKPRYFQVLWLRYREEFSMQEIAETLGTTNINTKVLLHRARSGLAKKLTSAGMLPTHHLS